MRSKSCCCSSVIWSAGRVTRMAACLGEILSGALGDVALPVVPPTRNKARHHGAFPWITFLPDLLIETGGVVATLIPALLEIVGKLVHFRWPTVRRLPFGKLSSPQPAPDGLPFHAQGRG